jgi:hypothetical protein
MPKAYSLDLRERVVRFVEEGHSRPQSPPLDMPDAPHAALGAPTPIAGSRCDPTAKDEEPAKDEEQGQAPFSVSCGQIRPSASRLRAKTGSNKLAI